MLPTVFLAWASAQRRTSSAAGRGVHGEGQALPGDCVAGQGHGHDLRDPAGLTDRGDVSLDRGTVASGVAAGQSVGPLVKIGIPRSCQAPRDQRSCAPMENPAPTGTVSP